MEKPIDYTMPVYVLTKSGNNINSEGVKAVNDIILGNENAALGLGEKECEAIKSELPDGVTGILIHHGPDLLNAGYLANLLEKDKNARVVVSFVDHFAVCPYGPSETNGIDDVIYNLRLASKSGKDSWTMMTETCRMPKR